MKDIIAPHEKGHDVPMAGHVVPMAGPVFNDFPWLQLRPVAAGFLFVDGRAQCIYCTGGKMNLARNTLYKHGICKPTTMPSRPPPR